VIVKRKHKNKSKSIIQNPFLKRFYWAFGLIIFALVLGIIGYMGIERFTFLEAFYMTVITLASVGFMEVHPLSDAGRIFTSLLIITNIGIFAYSLSAFTSFIIEGDLSNIYKKYKMQKKINDLKDHIVICGYGRNGRKVAEEFLNSRNPFVVIEKNISRMKHDLTEDLLYIDGDATDDKILMLANLKEARALLTTLPSDPDNLYVVLSAREINKNLIIVSRASEESSQSKLRSAGANHIIIPEHIGGAHMASLIIKPAVVDFLKGLNTDESSIHFEEINIGSLKEEFIDASIKLMNEKISGVCIMGIVSEDGKLLINPDPGYKWSKESKLVVIGNKIQIMKLKKN
jgi:voltage-gated potassium channel